MLSGLADISRLILFDKRGTGMSDRLTETMTFEQRMDDVRAVMDAVGSERAALLGLSEGASMSVLFAATYPERATALVLYGGCAYATRAEQDEQAINEEEARLGRARLHRGARGRRRARRPAETRSAAWTDVFRYGASPGAAGRAG